MTGIYYELLCKYAPKPIQSETDYEQVQSLIDMFLDAPSLTNDQKTFLTLLGILIENYEDDTYLDMELRGIALIKALLDNMEMKQKDLVPIFKAESTVSAVLNGHRRLTVEQIDKLATFFQLPHSYFFESNDSSFSQLALKSEYNENEQDSSSVELNVSV